MENKTGISADTVEAMRVQFEKNIICGEDALTGLRLLERNDSGEYLASWTRSHWKGFQEGYAALLASGEVYTKAQVEEILGRKL